MNPGFLNSRAALAATGFGQGELQVTPLQMAMVAATIANDGMMMRPFLVAEIVRPDGTTVVRNGPRPIRRVMPVNLAARMRANLRAGVAYGFGKAADAVPGVEVGGKSGTAEYPCPTRDNPERLCAHAWFIAIAPVEQPRFAVAVMIEMVVKAPASAPRWQVRCCGPRSRRFSSACALFSHMRRL